MNQIFSGLTATYSMYVNCVNLFSLSLSFIVLLLLVTMFFISKEKFHVLGVWYLENISSSTRELIIRTCYVILISQGFVIGVSNFLLVGSVTVTSHNLPATYGVQILGFFSFLTLIYQIKKKCLPSDASGNKKITA